MEFVLTTLSETSPLEVLDMHVQNRREAGQSFLSVRFECRRGRERDHLKLPWLTWFDANQLQQFTQRLLSVGRFGTCQVDLPDAGLRLTGHGRQFGEHTIRIEPLPNARKRFSPFVINSNELSLSRYTRLLSQRLWEAFCRG
ncbi:MAG: hypothetical protein H7Z72_18680 [Bacteroidetes bacterium]|nr:hypothetical protein [Fibrella sp.]